MKKWIKFIWALFCHHTRLMSIYAWFKNKRHGGMAVILLYHRIIPTNWNIRVSSVPEIKVTMDSFEKQLQILSKSYRVISFEELIQNLKQGRPLQPRTVVISFDDGWEDNYKYAWPLLRKYDLPAIIFLTTGYIGTHRMFWQERFLSLLDRISHATTNPSHRFQDNNLQELQPYLDWYIAGKNVDQARLELLQNLKEKGEHYIDTLMGQMSTALKRVTPAGQFNKRKSDSSDSEDMFDHDNSFLSWQQVREMKGNLITYGSHSVNHKFLDQESEMVVLNELEESKKHLEGNLNCTIKYFAYPNGNYDDLTLRCLNQTGYEAALTTEEGIVRPNDDLYRLKRINAYENRFQAPNGQFSPAMFLSYLTGCSNIFSYIKSKNPSHSRIALGKNRDRLLVEKIKWDSKISEISEKNDKPCVNSYDDVFLSMNRLRPVHRFFSLEDKSASILDLGCGAGWTSILLAQKAKVVHALDISFKSIRKLIHYQKKYALQNIHASVGNGEVLPYRDNCFDYVFGNAILHHLLLEQTIAEVSRVLKNGGKAAFCEPFAHNPIMNIYRYIKHNFLEEFHGTDKPLSYNDMDIFSRYFSEVSIVECSFLSDKVTWLRPVEKALLEKFPGTKKYASYITILAIK